ncbi:MAG: fimbria/pilus outer membrane usher protein [Terracidiphilus sp.]|nr:fimbria/pilus outer membrane usher protein [Terracidiphilus sp.]
MPNRDRNLVGEWLCCIAVVFSLALMLAPLAWAAPPSPNDKDASSDPLPSEPASSDDQILLLDVIVNGHSIGKIGEFTLRRGTLYARPQELRDLGFAVGTTHTGRGGLILLNSLQGFVWTLDISKQQLRVIAVDEMLTPTIVHPTPVEPEERRRQIESGTGLTLNYDTLATFTSAGQGGSGAFDLRAFSPLGLTTSTWQVDQGTTLAGSGMKPITRLDSTYSFADVHSLRRYSVGDYINGALSWQRPVHMEGLQIRSDFSMRPDLITFPLPSITGSAAVPSTVDVLVNGNVVSSTQVDPGPFQIQQLPVISGSGTITMTMTNTLGQQVTVSQPFYGGSTLLATGLHTFSAQAGLVRRNWGTVSNDYGKLAAVGNFRRGMSQRLTVEFTGETTSGASFASAGASGLLGSLALVNVDVAAGTSSSGVGELFSAGVQHIGRIFSLGGSAILATRNFRDIASVNGSGVLRKQISAFTGVSVRRYGSLGLAYAGLSEDPSNGPANAFNVAQHTHVVTANYSVQLGRRLSFFATEFRSLDSAGSSGFQAGLTLPIGRRRSASVGGSSTGSVQLQTQLTPVRIGDWGYQAYASEGDSAHEFGEVQYKSPAGLLTAGIDNSAGVNTVRLETQGALSLVDGALFPSNTVYDSFAVVDTAPVAHVHIYQENRDVGTTDRSGRLLVPDMRAFDLNHIGIEPRDIPPDVSFALDKRIVRPQDRSGVVVRFPAHFSHSALLRLVDTDGKAVPLGSTATLRSTGVTVPVGYDGEAYVEDLSQHNQLVVLRDGHPACTASFEYPSTPGDIPTIGPVRCTEVQP